MDELKPCPFCASANVEANQYTVTQGLPERKVWEVECCNCGACGPNELGKSSAIEMWNMRREQPFTSPEPQDSQAALPSAPACG